MSSPAPSLARRPRASVFLFCRNRAQTIRRSVESVLAQTFTDFEYVIQDGASTDGTLEILREYDDPRIRLVSVPDRGPADAFWRAIRRCQGDYVSACLSDEELLPTHLSDAVAVLDREPATAALTRDAALTSLLGRPMGMALGRPFDLHAYMANRFAPNFAAATFRRRALEAIGLHTDDWDLDCGEFELWCRLAMYGHIAYLPGVVARYAIHPGQLSGDPENVPRIARGRLRVIERLARETSVGDDPSAVDACRAATIASFSRHLLDLGASEAAVDLALDAAGDPGRLPPPDAPDAAMFEYVRIARRQQEAGQDVLALQILEAARTFATADARLLCEIGVSHTATGYVDHALAAFDAAIAADPSLSEAHWQRGLLLERRGRIDEALAAWRQSDLSHHRDRHSLYLNACLKSPTATNQSLYEAHREWNRLHAQPSPALRDFCFPDWQPGAVITLGYACSYWDADTITFQLLPLLRRHDRRRFRVIAYAPAEPGPLVQQAVDAVRIVAHLSNEQYVEQVRRDGVHILIELNGYSVGHWFAAMASRCAPVQVSYLNYTSTCGVDAVDYVIADAIALPPDQDVYFTEEVYRVPGCFFCFTYEGTQLPALTPPPSASSGSVTFGCFGSGSKINAPLIELWAEILRRTPGSRLFLRNNELTPPDNRRAMQQAFARLDVDASRLLILPGTTRQGVLASYGQVDISLDTFPYCGGNTIAESLWQGVPVVTLKGDRFSAAYGASLLTASGLAELVATTPEEYVRKAVELARDSVRLASYRANLREMVHRHGFSDADQFAVKMETAYADMVARAYRRHRPHTAAPSTRPGSQWLRDVSRVLTDIPTPRLVVAGACCGNLARALGDALPTAELHACEARRTPFESLQAALASRPATASRLALGSFAGTYSDPSSGDEVPMTTLAAFCADRGIDRIDLLTLDARGRELDLLHGAAALIRSGRLRMLSFEFGEHHIATRTFLADFLELLPHFAFFRESVSGWQPLSRHDGAATEHFHRHRIVAMPEANRHDVVRFAGSARR